MSKLLYYPNKIIHWEGTRQPLQDGTEIALTFPPECGFGYIPAFESLEECEKHYPGIPVNTVMQKEVKR
jgi:hypothetical protein